MDLSERMYISRKASIFYSGLIIMATRVFKNVRLAVWLYHGGEQLKARLETMIKGYRL